MKIQAISNRQGDRPDLRFFGDSLRFTPKEAIALEVKRGFILDIEKRTFPDKAFEQEHEPNPLLRES